ncbi:aldo/keto reductase family oxidoreductase, partial [Rhizobium johnstonii]
FFDGVFLGDNEPFADLHGAIDELAKAYVVTPTGIAVAWIPRHPAKIQIMLGTTKQEHVVEDAAGSSISMNREEWYRPF